MHLVFVRLTANFELLQQLLFRNIWEIHLQVGHMARENERLVEVYYFQEYEGMSGNPMGMLCKKVIILKSNLYSMIHSFISELLTKKVFIKYQWYLRHWSWDGEIMTKRKQMGSVAFILLLVQLQKIVTKQKINWRKLAFK